MQLIGSADCYYIYDSPTQRAELFYVDRQDKSSIYTKPDINRKTLCLLRKIGLRKIMNNRYAVGFKTIYRKNTDN